MRSRARDIRDAIRIPDFNINVPRPVKRGDQEWGWIDATNSGANLTTFGAGFDIGWIDHGLGVTPTFLVPSNALIPGSGQYAMSIGSILTANPPNSKQFYASCCLISGTWFAGNTVRFYYCLQA